MKKSKHHRLQVSLCAFVLCALPLGASAQRTVPKLEDLPRRAIDTLDTNDRNVKIVIFTNNTWSYYYPDLQERTDKKVYREHWVRNCRAFRVREESQNPIRPVFWRIEQFVAAKGWLYYCRAGYSFLFGDNRYNNRL